MGVERGMNLLHEDKERLRSRLKAETLKHTYQSWAVRPCWCFMDVNCSNYIEEMEMGSKLSEMLWIHKEDRLGSFIKRIIRANPDRTKGRDRRRRGCGNGIKEAVEQRKLGLQKRERRYGNTIRYDKETR